MLPIGVIIPTKNSAAQLPSHLASLRSWLDRVEEVVVVDSFSTDGTLDLIKASLKHPRLSIHSHPPGLYQSWNFGISQLKTKYTYIASAGDLITGQGLQYLFDTAESLNADVVLSKPRFYDTRGEPLGDIEWPIDEIIRTFNITQARRLEPLQALVFAIARVDAALTGSCASDLFRTEVLQRDPFPTDFGVAGDGAWGVLQAAKLSWVVVPEKFSTFVKHPTNASEAERKSYRKSLRMDEVARKAVAAAQQSGVLSAEASVGLQLEALVDALTDYLEAKVEYDGSRRAMPPWILRPSAWRARNRRNQASVELERLRNQVLEQIKPGSKSTAAVAATPVAAC